MVRCDLCAADAENVLTARAADERVRYVLCGLHTRRLTDRMDRPPTVSVTVVPLRVPC